MRYYWIGWQGKGRAFFRALYKHRHVLTFNKNEADFFLTHFDRTPWREELEDVEKPIFMYPHAPESWWHYDVDTEPWERIACNFVIGQISVDVLKYLNYPKRVFNVGFPYSSVKPMRVTDAETILFAPIHPDDDGIIDADYRELNEETFDVLSSLGKKLTVCTVRDAELSGIPYINNVKYILSDKDPIWARSHAENYDLVVARGTFLYIAAALGTPTISFGCENIGHEVHNIDNKPRTLGAISDIWRHPYDILEAGDPARMIDMVCDSCATVDWRNRAVGGDFRQNSFVTIIEEYMNEVMGSI